MKRFKGLSRSQFMVAACSASIQAENFKTEKEIRQVENKPFKEATNPYLISNNTGCENHNDSLSEALDHSILFGHDFNILANPFSINNNLDGGGNSLLNDDMDNVYAQNEKSKRIILESHNMEKKNFQPVCTFLNYETQVNGDNNDKLQVYDSICEEFELPTKAQVKNNCDKLPIKPSQSEAKETLPLEEDDRFQKYIGIIAAKNKENLPVTTGQENCTGVEENNSSLQLERDIIFLKDIEIIEAECENNNLLMTTEEDCIGGEENNDYLDDMRNETKSDTSEKESDKESEEGYNDMKKRKRRKKFEQSNKRQANIDLRLGGQEYKSMVCKESGKYEEQIRPARIMENRCNHKSTTPKRPKTKINSKNNSSRTFLCANIDEDLRKAKFQEFWSLKSWDAKRIYVFGLIDKHKPYKRRSNIEQSRKSNSFDCYFHDKQGIKIRVCRTFFLNTLALGRDTFNRWLKAGLANTTEDVSENEPNSRKIQKNKQMRDSVIKWLEIIPKVPSHYCRSSSSRIYVESAFQSKTHMHSVYEQWCKENNKQHVACRVTFSKIMDEQKISIHRPRKDQCDTCYQYKISNLSQKEYEDHRKKKEEGREAKTKEKSKVSDKKLVITMDLQSVLLCPKLLVSKIYYSQKLQLHDFTIYSLNNGDVFLYVWHEGEGAVTSNDFVSCVSDFIKKMCDKYEEIVLISDGCNYQNRNRVLTSELSNLAVNKNIVIQQLILEKGHTMMEADSVHSTLENLFIPPIYSPGDYVSRMRAARPKHPYTVFQVDHTFFQDYESQPNNYISIRPGRKVGDPTVSDIRALQYLPSGKVQYKLRHVDDWADLPQRRLNKPTATLKSLYKAPRKLKKDKFNALQELKSVIPVEYHPFYDSLSHE